MIKETIKFSAAFGASLVLMGSVASAATIDLTGPGSVNVVVNSSSHKKGCKVTSKNKVAVLNVNAQKAKSGKAKANHNTTSAGDAVSGAATNANETVGTVDVANSAVDPCSCTDCEAPVDTLGDSITNTGPGSWNVILNGSLGNCGCKGGGTSVYSSNTVLVGNVNLQSAKSGKASSSGNTTGGSATSGNASNTNTTNLSVTVSNN
jgi:hypothetical protein